MNRNTDYDYEYHTPPHLPPLSVSLPSQTRPEPEPKLKLKLKPALSINLDDKTKPKLKPISQNDPRDLKKIRLEHEPEPKTQPKPSLTINPDSKPTPKNTHISENHPNNLKKTRFEPEPKPTLTINPDSKPMSQNDPRDLKKTRLEPQPQPQPKPQSQPQPRPHPHPQPQPQPQPQPRTQPKHSSKHDTKDLKKNRLEPELDPTSKNDTALVEKYYSPLTSPLPVTPENFPALPPPSHQIVQFNGQEENPPTNSAIGVGGGVRFDGVEDVVKRSKKEGALKRFGLGIRVLEIVFCLISFSVMAADQTQGWSGDSFYRYKEYRFIVAATVFGFVYAAFQAYDLGSYMATGKHVIAHRFRCQFDFYVDQIIAYLLISASSAAASRVDDWQANWGKDDFTAKASASISMAFLAFICFALSSLTSGYNLCNRDLY